ncbi:MAG: DUF3786 domain-containing protein [Anaerolineales bacterium]
MNKPDWMMGEPKPDLLGTRLAELRKLLDNKNPEDLATRSGTTYKSIDQVSGQFHTQLWDRNIVLTYPDFVAQDEQTLDELGASSQALLLYYFVTCDGTPASAQWVSFSELPDGRFYNQAYQGYSGGRLAQVFKNDFKALCQVSENLGGKRVYLLGDAAYEFQVLPMVSLLVVTWQGDEEFNSTYQILFDAAVSHHLPTDACAILGSNLTNRLITEMESLNENRH